MKFNWPIFNRNKSFFTLGRRIEVELPDLGLQNVTAKIDTGAYNGALHAAEIEEVKEGLRFIPHGGKPVVLDAYHKRKVKSSNGALSTRFAIETTLGFNGSTYPITLTLTDRSSMRHPMLIGRNFLRSHNFLIDVSQDKQ